MDLLTGMKPSANIELVKSRFACLQTLLIHALTFSMLKFYLSQTSTEEGRKAAYDALHGISSKLRSSTDASSDELYQKLINMIIGYLSGPSPHIKSGVVSALSVLVYSDPNICVAMPDVFPSVMELLHSKAIEVIKAVLGFVKVLVSCLTPDDLHRYLLEIMDGILRWSSVSRNHFREKIIVILEILMRKCGCAKVKALAPEKYKDFVHGVAENRHGKANSKEAGNANTKPDVSDMSSPRGQQKRERDDSAFSSKEEGSGRPWKKRDNRNNTGTSESTRPSGDLRKGKSNKSDANRFKRNISGGEKKRKGRSLFKSNERDLQRSSAAASRNPKHVKLVRTDDQRRRELEVEANCSWTRVYGPRRAKWVGESEL